MKASKPVLITIVLLLAGAGIAYAVRRRKKPATKNTRLDVGIPRSGTDSDDDATIKAGSKDEANISHLQSALNEIHRASKYINTNCGGIKWPYLAGSLANGNIVNENGVFDAKTVTACKYYLNREEVDIDFLNMVRKKLSAYRAGDKCVHPLSITV